VGMLEELDRFCGSSTGSMVAVEEAQGARSFLWELDEVYGCSAGESRSSTGSMVAVGEAQRARSFLWEFDEVYGCCGGGSRSSIVSVKA